MEQFIKRENIWVQGTPFAKKNEIFQEQVGLKDKGIWIPEKDSLMELTLVNSTAVTQNLTARFRNFNTNIRGRLFTEAGAPIQTMTWVSSTDTVEKLFVLPAQSTTRLILESATKVEKIKEVVDDNGTFVLASNAFVKSIDHIHSKNYGLEHYPRVVSSILESVPNHLPSAIKVINHAFWTCTNFNGPLDRWDTSNVKQAVATFASAKKFNQPLPWDTSNIETMNLMFSQATIFDQDVSGWNVGKVTDWTNFRQLSALSNNHTPLKFR